MKIGILGAATVGQFLARHIAAAGHDVILSNSRGPETLRALVAQLGDGVTAGPVAEALASPLVILGVPWTKIRNVLTPDIAWNGRILVDATNIFTSYAPDFKIDDLGDDSGSEIVARLAPSARVVKAFNTLPIETMFSAPPGDHFRRVLFVASDDDEAGAAVRQLVSDIGLHPVAMGSLAAGGRLMQLGGPLSGLELFAAIEPEA